MKTTYAWAAKRNSGTYGKHVIYAGITQRPNVSDRFSGGYKFKDQKVEIGDYGRRTITATETIRVRKSDIVLLETHELKSYYDQDLMNNFHEQLYINAVRDAGEHLKRLGVPVKVGNVNDVIKYFNSWRISPEACEADCYTPSKCKEYIFAKEIYDKNPDRPKVFNVDNYYYRNRMSYRTQRKRRKTFWKDTACKKFIDWCESENSGRTYDVGVYNSIMKTLREWSNTEERWGREWLNSTRRKDKDG
jgi:hypothetical protein